MPRWKSSSPGEEVTDEAMLRQSQVNLHATVGLIQAFLPAMSSRGWGRILAIGSVQEERPNAGHLFYSATKAAQTSMILNLARNERAPGVTFNVLAPRRDPHRSQSCAPRRSRLRSKRGGTHPLRTHRRPRRLRRRRAAVVLGRRQLYQRCSAGGGRRHAAVDYMLVNSRAHAARRVAHA